MIPDIILAGATLQWEESIDNYTASETCTLKYTFINSSNKYTISSAPEDPIFTFDISSTVTANYAAGDYAYQKYIEDENGIHIIGEGRITVKPFFAGQTTFDDRSHAEKMLEAIEALLENRATVLQSSMTFKNRALQYLTFDELIKAKNYYENIILQENTKKMLDSNGTSPRLFIQLQ